jgi:transposase
MSTSLLYHGFDIRRCQYVRNRYVGGSVIFTIERDRYGLRCPVYNSNSITLRGRIERTVKALPIGKKPVYIDFPVQRVGCRSCGSIRQPEIGFAAQRRTYTNAFERYALELSRHTTILDVAEHLGVGWDLVKEIQKRNTMVAP